MSMIIARRPAVVALALLMALAALATPAAAHVTIAQRDQQPGSFTALTFSVGHGCEGSPTVELAIQVPEGVNDVTPEIVAGWDVEVETEELAEPVDGPHGETVAEREAVVVYTGSLPDGFRQTFDIGLRVPDDAEGMLFWPTVQTCEDGEHRWVEIPEEGQDPFELDEPAPFIVVAARGEDDRHGASSEESPADEAPEVEAAVDEDGAADEAEDDVAVAAATDDGGTDALTIVALLAGLVGVAVGVTGVGMARRALRGSPSA